MGLMTMNVRRRLVATIVLVAFVTFAFGVFDVGLKVYAEGGEIDLFSGKVPYDGRGLNQRSDAFQPQELVELYARVTYNKGPIANWLVAFQVLNPLNKTVAVGVNWTNNDGIASFSFRVPWPSSEGDEREVFGAWKAVATVMIADKVFMDTLTFQVGWLVQVTAIKTLNADLVPQTSFRRGEIVVLNLTVKNIALTSKPAVLIIDVFDHIGCPVTNVIYDAGKPFDFQPGESFIQVISKVPDNATIGRATVSAVAYTALPEYGGVAYSPPCTSHFDVLPPLKVQHYLAVKTEPSGIVLIPGEGWYDEGVNVSLTAPDVVPVFHGARYKFKYWDVDGVALAGNTVTAVMDRNHTATAHYTLQYYLDVVSSYGVVGGEGWYDANETAYAFLDAGVLDHYNGTRRVFVSWGGDASGIDYSRSGPILMDGPKTAVACWKTQYLLVVATDPAGLKPQPSRSPAGEAGPAGGWWYDAFINVSLVAPPVKGYDFNHWTVDGQAFDVGKYELTIFMNKPHNVVAHYSVRVAGWFIPEWFYWILLLILVVVIILLCVWIYRRRREAKAGEASFERGWTAWYYGYDLLGRRHH